MEKNNRFTEMKGMYFILFALCMSGNAYAQKSESSSSKRNQSVRKAEMVIVGENLTSHTAAASTGDPNAYIESGGPECLGIQYYPLSNVDKGPARLQERKFKWTATYAIQAYVSDVALIDALSDVYAVASVVGDGFPGSPLVHSGGASNAGFAIGPFSLSFPAIGTVPQNQSNVATYVELDQHPITEETPREESLYKWVTGNALVDVKVGLASTATATAIYRYHTVLKDQGQFSTAEAFYYAHTIRH